MANQNLDILLKAMRDPDAPLPLETVRALDREYPFMTLADSLLLRRAGTSLDPDTRRELRARLALYAPDPKTLFTLIDQPELADFYPCVEEKKVSTDDAITTFLETYGSSDPAQDALLERLIFNPVPDDYASTLVGADDAPAAPADEQDSLIDAFLKKEEPETAKPRRPEPETPVEPEPELPPKPAAKTLDPDEELPPPYVPKKQKISAPAGSLQESLAKIYIKQRRYDKAYEIIHALSLNNSEKSVYFADQLRFLQKLILIQQYKNNN